MSSVNSFIVDLVLYLLFLSLKFEITFSKCSKSEFTCNDKTCIPKSWVCDYEKDCSRGEDEKNCDNCKLRGYICHQTSKCIPPQWKCDKWTDCLLQDDEKFCRNCTKNEFRCNDNECIPMNKKCDFHKDCRFGEDENLILSKYHYSNISCPKCLSLSNTFKCDNNQTCLQKHKICDGIPDCQDKMDECKCKNISSNIFYGKCGKQYINITLPKTTQNPIKKVFKNDNETPHWKYCPDKEKVTWLGFITYPEKNPKEKKRYEDNPILKAKVQPNSTQVFFIEPKLRNFVCLNGGSDCNYKIASDKRSGQHFTIGKHTVRYIGKSKGGRDDEATQCIVRILVLGGMKQSEIDLCKAQKNLDDSKRKGKYWKFTVDENYFVITKNAVDNKGVDIDTARFYLPQEYSHLDCYAKIAFRKVIHPRKNLTVLENIFDWMLRNVWPIVGIVVAIIFLICGLCACVIFLWRKNSEFKHYEKTRDLELTDDSEEEPEMTANRMSTSLRNTPFVGPTRSLNPQQMFIITPNAQPNSPLNHQIINPQLNNQQLNMQSNTINNSNNFSNNPYFQRRNSQENTIPIINLKKNNDNNGGNNKIENDNIANNNDLTHNNNTNTNNNSNDNSNNQSSNNNNDNNNDNNNGNNNANNKDNVNNNNPNIVPSRRRSILGLPVEEINGVIDHGKFL